MSAPFGDLAAGATLGRYELLLPIAQGGMAQVWAARLRGTRGFSKTVAVKTMLPALSADPRFEKMFLAEAELASRIKHPNVCEILDLGEEGGVLYLVMEWIDGESLVTLAADCEAVGRSIPFEVAARIGLDAARGLHAAHELKDDDGALVGVVHRDVSPHNILVTHAGQVKIVDFGVAKAVSRADHQATSTGHLKGKVPYMSPEQVYCEEIDRRADVFALGIVLYQLTTGTHPFRTDNELATLALITSPDPVRSPESLVPGYPAALGRVVAKALAKDKAERHATMAELARDLEGAIGALAAAGHAVTTDAFVSEALGRRAAARAQALKAAARAADEHAGKTPTGLASRPSVDETASTPALTLRSDERRPGRSVALAAAAAGIGLGLGIAGLYWGTRVAPAARGGDAPPPVTTAASSAPPATGAASAPAPASASPSAEATSSPEKPAPSAATAVPPRPRPPMAPPKTDGARPPPKSSLRNPGF